MRLFIDWGLLLFSALTRSRVAQSFLLSLRPSVLSSIFLPFPVASPDELVRGLMR